MKNNLNLYVDLDNTLIRSDFLFECFVNFFSKDILAPVKSMFVLLTKGRKELKKYLYFNSKISYSNLPYNNKTIEFIRNWKRQNNGEVILISASYHEAVSGIAEYLKIFDGAYGTDEINLKSTKKLEKINQLNGGESFSYIGDSADDIAIWEKADRCIAVNPSKSIEKKLIRINYAAEIIRDKGNFVLELLNTIRIHQWIKNALLFVPAVLSLQAITPLSLTLIKGFLSLSFIASAFYVVNDLFDIENDRNHHSKKNRTFASGKLSIPTGFLIFLFLILGSVFFSFTLPNSFKACLLLYAVSTFVYSKYLKKIPILDIFMLSYLYLLRIIAGGVLVNLDLSNWLLTFSVFFFLFLAAVKRWVELKKMKSDNVPGRGYRFTDISFVSQLSYFAGLISILVICLYIESQQARELYEASQFLWFVPVILLYWVLETLFKVERGEVDDDPVKYALKSKTSYVSLVGFILILYLASVL